MTDREQYTPGPASGAQVRKDGEKWTLILVRDLRHSPEKVWQALTEPAHLREWAPFETDGSLGTVGTVKLTWVGTPTPIETRVVGTRGFKWRHAPDAVAHHRSPLHLVGRRGMAHLLRRSGSPSQRNSHRPYRWWRGHEVQRLAAIERRVRQAVRR
jgi:hypothetical protein